MATKLRPRPAAPRTVSFEVRGGEAPAKDLTGWLSLGAIAVIALGVRLIQLDHPPFIDEFNHIFAARSFLSDGTLTVASDEPYRRARLFTYMVAAAFRVFGESLVVARVIAVLAGTALVTLMFWWVRRYAGVLAAWISALLLCFYPMALFLSQITRFYTVQALLYWTAVVLIHAWVARHPNVSRSAAYVLAAAVCLALGTHLFPLTIVGAAGLAAWAIPAQIGSLGTWLRADRRNRWLFGGFLLLAGVYAVSWALSGGAEWAWRMFMHADLWAESNRNNAMYYHDILIVQYGSLWSIFPFLALLALVAKPRLTLLCLTIFGVAFAFHSVAAWKSERYIFYAMPAFFTVTGIALASVMHAFHRHAQANAARLLGGRVPPALVTVVLVVLLLVSVRASYATNQAFRTAHQIVSSPDGPRPPPYTRADWPRIAPLVRPIIADGAIVMASANLHSLYYLNRLDYDLSALHLNDFVGPQPEFAIHHKTATPVISEPESLEHVMRCHARGVVLIEAAHWWGDTAVPERTRNYIAEHLSSLELPESSGIVGFEWRDGMFPRGGATCPPSIP
jgi:hypothetical protein